MLAEAATGAAVGFSLAAPPGPMNAIIAAESVRGGARAGIRVGLAAPIVDTLYLALFVAGLARLVDLGPILPYAALAGAALLAFFAVGTARAAANDGGRGPVRPTFWTVFALSATNPYQLAWWATGGTVLMASAGGWGVAGFLATIYAWVFVWAAMMSGGARRWDWFPPAVAVVSADTLLVFAIALAAQAF